MGSVHPGELLITVLIRRVFIVLTMIGAIALPQCVSADGASPAPPPSSSSVVYCFDRARDVVSRVLASECHGDVVSESFAKAAEERHDAATLRALNAQSKQGPEGLRLARIGTAFYIDDSARLLTNNHVIQDCRSITVAERASGETQASVLAIDEKNDLALLAVKGSQHEVAHFRTDEASLSDMFVATVGYPDQGMPPLEPMIISGTVIRAAAGMADGNILFKAPVRRGNSGGPIFDSRGGVVGVVRARVDEVQTYSATGHVVEDTAVGVGLDTVLDFMDQHGGGYMTSGDSEVSNQNQILAHATEFVVRAECWQ
jgi:serine protease Do